jgi:hypothetical protein
MNLDLDRCAQEIQEARLRAQSLVSDLPPSQLTEHPDPGMWSIVECLAHLNMTAATVQKFMVHGIERGKQEKTFGSGPFSIGPKGRLMVWIAEPPPKFRIRAPKNVRPPAIIDDPLQVLPQFLHAQDEWERLMREQEGLNLAKIKVGQGAFRLRLAAALPWMMAHQRRHLLQAENVKRQILAAAPNSVAQSV